MPEANGRRRGMGSPEPTPEPAAGPHRSRDGGFLRQTHTIAASAQHTQRGMDRAAGRQTSQTSTAWRSPATGSRVGMNSWPTQPL